MLPLRTTFDQPVTTDLYSQWQGKLVKRHLEFRCAKLNLIETKWVVGDVMRLRERERKRERRRLVGGCTVVTLRTFASLQFSVYGRFVSFNRYGCRLPLPWRRLGKLGESEDTQEK